MKKNRRKLNFVWIFEDYLFGALALRDEIKRHKEEDEKKWGLIKALSIRLLYIYMIIAVVVLACIGTIGQKLRMILRSKK